MRTNVDPPGKPIAITKTLAIPALFFKIPAPFHIAIFCNSSLFLNQPYLISVNKNHKQ